ILLQFLGRYEDAIPVFEWLARRDPVNATAIGNLGFARLLAGQFEEAKNAIEKALVLSPEDVDWLWGRIRLLYFYAQDYESALHSCESLDDVPALKLYCLAWVYPQLGREDEGKTALLALEQTHDKDWASPIAQYYAWHNQPDAAIDWLEKGYQIDGKAAVSSAWRDWIYDPIRDDPGFQELLERTGVSREQLAAIEFEVPLPD
ncbi:MAG: tetratricopeptide repeat protein, partial [Gammaproteobacteria bacterium]